MKLHCIRFRPQLYISFFVTGPRLGKTRPLPKNLHRFLKRIGFCGKLYIEFRDTPGVLRPREEMWNKDPGPNPGSCIRLRPQLSVIHTRIQKLWLCFNCSPPIPALPTLLGVAGKGGGAWLNAVPKSSCQTVLYLTETRENSSITGNMWFGVSYCDWIYGSQSSVRNFCFS